MIIIYGRAWAETGGVLDQSHNLEEHDPQRYTQHFNENLLWRHLRWHAYRRQALHVHKEERIYSW